VKVSSAQYLKSSPQWTLCPEPNRPEIAFIGRSNVGKSSLINMLAARKGLAKTSSAPGKTQMINHFDINNSMYWVDLPGYGYAKVSKKQRASFIKMIWNYLEQRTNLMCLFVLIDSRHQPQQVDLDFISELGERQIPLSLVFTKSDKSSQKVVQRNRKAFEEQMLNQWEVLPPLFMTSAVKGTGREELMDFIANMGK